jgi:hypothetical protein
MLSTIVKRALVYTVTDIGQLSVTELRDLNTAIHKGWLSKGRGGKFPMVKTVYARPDFDFKADRLYWARKFVQMKGGK